MNLDNPAVRRFFLWGGMPLLGKLPRRHAQKQAGLSFELASNRRLLALIFAFHRRCYKLDRSRQKLAWVNLPSVTELFYAFDVIPFMPEGLGGLMASLGFSDVSLDKASELGYSRDTCTFCNHVLGVETLGQLPPPDLVASTMITLCDAQAKSFEAAARKLGAPFHPLHLPDRQDPAALEFFVDELRGLVGALEELTGTELDPQRLRRSIARSNRATTSFLAFLEQRRRRPSPIKGLDALSSQFPMYNLLGDQDAVADFYDALCAELEAVPAPPPAPATGATAGARQIRLLSAGHYYPLYDPALLQELEALGVSFVAEVFSTVAWRPIDAPEEATVDEMLLAIARKYLDQPTVGSFERRGEIALDLARRWDVDGVVTFLPWGCRMIGSSAFAVAEVLKAELGVPTLIIDADPLDKSIYASGAVRTRIHAFVEMLRTTRRDQRNHTDQSGRGDRSRTDEAEGTNHAEG